MHVNTQSYTPIIQTIDFIPSKAVWNISENSSISVALVFPQDGGLMMMIICQCYDVLEEFEATFVCFSQCLMLFILNMTDGSTARLNLVIWTYIPQYQNVLPWTEISILLAIRILQIIVKYDEKFPSYGLYSLKNHTMRPLLREAKWVTNLCFFLLHKITCFFKRWLS